MCYGVCGSLYRSRTRICWNICESYVLAGDTVLKLLVRLVDPVQRQRNHIERLPCNLRAVALQMAVLQEAASRLRQNRAELERTRSEALASLNETLSDMAPLGDFPDCHQK